jgi:hypothetical protein
MISLADDSARWWMRVGFVGDETDSGSGPRSQPDSSRHAQDLQPEDVLTSS